MKQKFFLSAGQSILSISGAAQIQTETEIDALYIQENYIKTEHLIPMRDGIRLYTVIYSPKNHQNNYPILLQRSPYSAGPYGEALMKPSLGPSMLFARDEYIFVYQDVRGRYLSEGEFVANRPHIPEKPNPKTIDESTDSYDTIDWLIKNVGGNNGKVGTWGISAPGFYTTMTAIDAHPALKAASPQAPVTDWFMGDDRHHNGAFFLMGTFSFLSYYGTPRPVPTTEHAQSFNNYGTPDAYTFYKNLGPLKNINQRYFKGENKIWNEMMENPDYTEFWKARTPVPYLKKIKPAMLTVGGWFDQEDLYGPLQTFAAIEANTPQSPNHLVIGPWTHGSWSRGDNSFLGNIRFHSATGPYYRQEIELAFFSHYLKDKPNPYLAKATVFETGSNTWKKYSSWPPSQATRKKLYILPNGKLSFEEPQKANQSTYDEYISDPDRPVPYTNQIRIDRGSDFMYEDQRFTSRRPDVLVYTSETLEQDICISGKIIADLFISASGTDADLIVKLIDVYPGDAPDDSPLPGTKMGGFQQLVRAEVMRAKYRNSFSNPQALDPGTISALKFDMQDAAHTFKKSHKIMIQIQSTWFPLVDINPQKFVNIYQADENDFQKATIQIHFKPGAQSGIILDIIEDHN